MFSFLTPEGSMALRDRFGETYPTDPVMQHGSVMNGYIADLDELGRWFADAWAWIGTPDPKPTKR